MTKKKKPEPRINCNGCIGLRYYFGKALHPIFTYCDYPSNVDVDDDTVTFHHRKIPDIKVTPDWCQVNCENK